MKIGYFSPLSPIKSGISEYSEREVLPYLKDFCDIDLIIDNNYSPTNSFVKNNFKTIPYDEFENKYDLLIYHMGNNPFHEYMYKMALNYPGVIVLHDPFLHHLQVHMTVAQKDEESYRKIMEYCLGPKGKKIAENALISYVWPHFEYPLVKKIIDSSLSVIVHSKFAREIILKETNENLIKQIKMPITPSQTKNSQLRNKLKIPANSLLIGTFGHVGFYKRIDVSLKAFSKFLKTNPNSYFLIVGEFQTKEFKNKINDLVKKLGLKDKVIETGYVEDLFPYVDISDIIVQLRYPTAGETSIITLQIMSMGKPILISNVGSFKEIPDESSIKIDVDENEEDSILNGFQKLTSFEYRAKMGENARKYVESEHDPKKIAYEFYNFCSYIKNPEKMKILNQNILNLDLQQFQNLKPEEVLALAKNNQKSLV